MYYSELRRNLLTERSWALWGQLWKLDMDRAPDERRVLGPWIMLYSGYRQSFVLARRDTASVSRLQSQTRVIRPTESGGPTSALTETQTRALHASLGPCTPANRCVLYFLMSTSCSYTDMPTKTCVCSCAPFPALACRLVGGLVWMFLHK